MQQPPKIFQIVLIGFFVIMLILGFLGFSGKLPLPTSKKNINYGAVSVWGTLPAEMMQKAIADALRSQQGVSIVYVEKKEDVFYRDFIEALARGTGPDLILLPQDEVLKNLDKLNPIQYASLSERDFKNLFLEESELYLRPEGIVALPMIIDPIVMYWNRDMFTNAGIVAPPRLWKELYDFAPKITIRDNSGNISRSFVAFGGYRNIAHAKEVISLLLMQAGSPIVSNRNGMFSAQLIPTTSSTPETENPALSAVRFFTEFSKVEKNSYSWNSSLPNSRTMFESGDLALYFGYASEYNSIRQKNPHLNFDVAVVPQMDKAPRKLTFGKMYGVAMVRISKNPQGAFQAAIILSGKNTVEQISTLLQLPPARRDLVAVKQSNPNLTVFYDSALISRAWLDPSSTETSTIFMNMIGDILSGRSTMSQAVTTAQGGLMRIIQSIPVNPVI